MRRAAKNKRLNPYDEAQREFVARFRVGSNGEILMDDEELQDEDHVSAQGTVTTTVRKVR